MGNTIQQLPEAENKIILPRTTEKGKPRISYSQYSLWKDKKSFNLGVDGWREYMISYFLKYEFQDKGWAEFGNDVEAYICKKKGSDKFDDRERLVMDEIETLGVFQTRYEIDFGDFVFLGVIDDRREDWKKLRDYKTASKNSSQKFRKPDYVQLDFYAMKSLEINGELPEIEVCAVERKGNCFETGGRDVLTVGNEVWYIPIKTSLERIEWLKEDLKKVVNEISDHYKIFKLLSEK